MMITDKINFKQPKYVLPAILYPLLLISGYLIFDIFDTEPAETGNTLQTTEFLNPELPQARVDNNGGIDGKYESMVKSYGRIQDFSAVENIERNNNKDDKEAYESKYTEDDLALLDMEADKRTEELERLREMQERLRKSAEKGEAMNNDTVSLPLPDEDGRIARSEQRRKEALAELDKALAEARLQGRKGLEPTPDNTDTSVSRPMTTGTVTDRNVEVNDNIVHEIADDAETGQVVKKIKTSSDYFHTLAENADGTYAILTKASDCKSGLDVYDWSKSAGGNINEWNYWGGDCQKWELVTAVKNSGSTRETFTVRKSSNGVGVEKTWPIHSPHVVKVEVIRQGKVRRAKLNYLRDRVGKAAKVKERVR